MVVKLYRCWEKLAATVLLESILTEQAPEPEQAPYQWVKVWPWDGVAVTITGVPDA